MGHTWPQGLCSWTFPCLGSPRQTHVGPLPLLFNLCSAIILPMRPTLTYSIQYFNSYSYPWTEAEMLVPLILFPLFHILHKLMFEICSPHTKCKVRTITDFCFAVMYSKNSEQYLVHTAGPQLMSCSVLFCYVDEMQQELFVYFN